MPTEVRIVEPKFFDQLNNGINFSLEPSNFAATLKANAGETIKFQTKVQIGTFWNLENWTWKKINSDTEGLISKSGVDFTQDFTIGDTISLFIFGTSQTGTGSVISVKPEQIMISLDDPATFPDSTPASDKTWAGTDVLSNTTAYKGLEYKYGLIENDESINFVSKLTSEELMYRVSGIDTLTTVQTGEQSGLNKAGYSGSFTVEYLGLVDNSSVINDAATYREYEINNIFDVAPWYRDGELESLEGDVVPPDDIYAGQKSLKYCFEAALMQTFTDPQSRKVVTWNPEQGNVGYFNEALNGFQTPYSLSNLTYFNVTENVSTDRLTVGNVVRVNYQVDSSDSTFSNTTPILVGHSALVSGDVYNFSTTQSLHQVWAKETLRRVDGELAISGDIIKNYTVTYVDATQIDIQYDVDLSIYAGQLEQNQDYILYCTVQNSAVDVNEGNKTQLLVDVNTYNKSADVEGLFGVDRQEQIPHPEDWVDSSTTTGYTNGVFNIEEGALTFFEFWIDTALDARLDTISFDLVVYNKTTSEYRTLRSVDFDLSDTVLVGDTQQIELNDTRPFILRDGDQFNFLQLTTTTKVIGSKQYYEALVGWKVPWQEWLAFDEAFTVFYNKSLPNNGLNQKSDRYFDTVNGDDYVLKGFVNASVSQNNIPTQYISESEDFHIYGYDEDDQPPVPPSFECSIVTRGDNGNGEIVDLENNMLQNGYCEINVLFTPDDIPTFSENVDFTSVRDTYTTVAYGERFTGNANPNINRNPNWLNGQADDVDTFGDGSSLFNKTQRNTLYQSTTTSIQALQNCNAYYGLIGLDDFEFYSITGQMYSTDADNDAIGFVISHFTDELGVEHHLSLVGTTGGAFLGLSPNYDPDIPDPSINNSIQTIAPPTPSANWALVYNYGKEDCVIIDSYFTTSAANLGWNNVNDLFFEVNRVGNNIEAIVNWNIQAVDYSNTFNFNLLDNDSTKKLSGANKFGFAFMSQDQGGFRNVQLTKVSADFYGILRLDPTNSPSDNDISELSTIREAPEDNILIQKSGDTITADLAYIESTNTFILSGQVNSSKLLEGQTYKISGQIGDNNLGV